ncbi:MAG TPA: presenilin family intramembrane aspartyl protease [Candidatus Nanoarchaeia archaeon]|nr:presenilin family intramembrane aspartyl protease [Candidatus Nanoarchaeia archaeon]
MKHSVVITLILLGMFILSQAIGLAVTAAYLPDVTPAVAENGTLINVTTYHLPYGMEPPEEVRPQQSLVSIVIALIIAITIMVLLMKFRAEIFLRLWFFAVVSIALGITLNAAVKTVPYASLFVLIIAIPLAYFKVFQRNIIVHNITEVLIYPGIAAIFVPLLSIPTTIILLVIISAYDMYAVWHSGFMQRLAHYQIRTLRVFSGFFIPYLTAQAKANLMHRPKAGKKVKVNVAILGGGDVVFPIIVAGVVLREFSLLPALLVTGGATLALAILFYLSEKGKFYPAMPFISLGCFLGLALVYLF